MKRLAEAKTAAGVSEKAIAYRIRVKIEEIGGPDVQKAGGRLRLREGDPESQRIHHMLHTNNGEEDDGHHEHEHGHEH